MAKVKIIVNPPIFIDRGDGKTYVDVIAEAWEEYDNFILRNFEEDEVFRKKLIAELTSK